MLKWSWADMASSPLPFASLENDFLRLDYLTTTGPRITGLFVHGVEGNFFAETPDVHWGTPHGEYYLRGGHRLWTAPENSFYTCPEEGLNVLKEKDKVILSSPIDASGLEKEISIQLNGNKVHLSQRVTWHGDHPIELAPWSITQLRLGSMAILPLSNADGLAPNRNLVLWPYAHIKDKRLELHDDLILLHGNADEQAIKVGNLNTHGWIACALGNALFIKHFSKNVTGNYPDLGCNVEAYVKDVCIELEALEPLVTLNKLESTTLEETWEIVIGEYPVNLETARIINSQIK